MAFTSPFESQPSSADLDRKIYSTDLFDDTLESEGSLIDTDILSPTTTDRKDSFATTSTNIFSPQSTGSPWDDYPVSTTTSLPERHITMAGPFSDNPMSNNPFHNHMSGWYKTQLAPGPYDSYPDNYSASSTIPTFSNVPNFNGLPNHMADGVRPATIMPPSATAPSALNSASPMVVAEQEVEAQRLNKRIRPEDPPQRGLDTYPGVRKKNARFEIPVERNLQNIDILISSCKNEDEVKELKQQKRLLRNRQAAYASHPDNLVSSARIVASFGFSVH
jgi:hypothetical protein